MIARLRTWFSGLGWLAGWRLARLLPNRVVRRAFEAFARRQHQRNARARAIVRANLEPVVPPGQLERTVRDAFLWYGRYWAETFRMEDLSSEELTARFETGGLEHIEKAYADGRGAVLATPHMGNWDAGGRFVAERWPLTVVVEVLNPRAVFDRFVEHRRALGMHIVPLERGGDATGACEAAIRRGELVALVADRDFTSRGVEVEMFGRRAKLPPGPAVLSLRTGAPLIPASILQHQDGSWFGRVLAPLDEPADDDADPVGVLTQRLAAAFERLISEAPAQWHVFNRFWPGP